MIIRASDTQRATATVDALARQVVGVLPGGYPGIEGSGDAILHASRIVLWHLMKRDEEFFWHLILNMRKAEREGVEFAGDLQLYSDWLERGGTVAAWGRRHDMGPTTARVRLSRLRKFFMMSVADERAGRVPWKTTVTRALHPATPTM